MFFFFTLASDARDEPVAIHFSCCTHQFEFEVDRSSIAEPSPKHGNIMRTSTGVSTSPPTPPMPLLFLSTPASCCTLPVAPTTSTRSSVRSSNSGGFGPQKGQICKVFGLPPSPPPGPSFCPPKTGPKMGPKLWGKNGPKLRNKLDFRSGFFGKKKASAGSNFWNIDSHFCENPY